MINKNTKLVEGISSKKHTLCPTWDNMKARCYNTNAHNYSRYGGRGIKICDRWLNSFKLFVQDMRSKPSKDHTVDRIDNNGDYEPNNCKWSTRKEQCSNRRTGNIPKGEKHWGTKLTNNDVIEIRFLYSTGFYSQLRLAIIFGVRDSYISRIINNKSRRILWN